MTQTEEIKRPSHIPEGARLVTMAELMDRVAKPGGSLQLGPRGSYLRMHMPPGPNGTGGLLGLLGTIRRINGGLSTRDGKTHRVFSLSYTHHRRTLGNWKTVVFTRPGWADRQLWIWTLDDEERARQARIAARGQA